MDQMLLWGLVLLGAAVLLGVLELFLPSGGLIAVVAGLTALTGVGFLFRYDTAWGAIGLLGVVVLGPVGFFVGLNVWTKTAIGRRFIGEPSEDEERARVEQEHRQIEQRRSLVGVDGVAITPLRPVGMVELDGRRYDAHAETEMIESGQRVRVSSVDGMHIKVRPATDR